MKKEHHRAWIPSVAGAGSGLIAAVLVCPLDVVKVRLQNQIVLPGTPPLYRGTFSTLGTVWRKEGLRGLFSGITPTVIAYLPDRAIWFTLYDAGRTRLPELIGMRKDSTAVNLLATLIASVTSTAATTPIWVIRTRLMTQMPSHSHTGYHYTSVYDAFRTIVREEGWSALYKGLGPSLLGVSHSLVMFPLYEKLKLWIQHEERKRSNNPLAPISAQGILLASAASKCIASLATYPHEVLRTRLQTQTTRTHIPIRDLFEGLSTFFFTFQFHHHTAPVSAITASDNSVWGGPVSERLKSGVSITAPAHAAASPPIPPKYRGIIQTARTIIKEEGIRSMYQGLSTSLIRQVPAGAISLWIFEVLCTVLER
ncbi:hypothetical protein HK101_002548 [Irineochytrium annulatum]|nr:hypothetical protein HK101_002548 [Irineochytrium annulatum]